MVAFAKHYDAAGNMIAMPQDYDAAGNLTSDGTLNYTYDAWNRQMTVSRASDGHPVGSYKFDGLNRRIEKTG